MNDREKQLEYRTRQLERQMKGVQRQVRVLEARMETAERQQDLRVRNLEIKSAVQSGLSQAKVAEIFDLSAARVSQIVKRA
ncbi:hypothetical protein [Pseudaeromonas paramecii]|uniref:RNA polymerase sigma-70 region 4 domain-containing protein n=1 Tax=Pseudaeromonas paramecii TaxID=2138166 RepID=A0ABP8PYF5_9GAMM